MKRKVIAGLMLLGLLLGGCGVRKNPAPTADATEVYQVPASFTNSMGSSCAEFLEVLQELGDRYFTDAQPTEDGIQIVLSAAQKQALKRHFEEWNEDWRKKLLALSDEYHYEQDLEGRKAVVYLDRQVPSPIMLGTLIGLACDNGLNQILEEKDPNWNVELMLYNSKTGKLVASANLPFEDFTVNDEAWDQSE